jgi:hypothetical protein
VGSAYVTLTNLNIERHLCNTLVKDTKMITETSSLTKSFLAVWVVSAFIFSAGSADNAATTGGESGTDPLVVSSREAIAISSRFLCADSCLKNKAGLSTADAEVVKLEVTNNPYCSQSERLVTAWAVKFGPMQMSSHDPEKSDGFTLRRSFTVLLDSSSGNLLEVRSDTIDNGQAFVSEFSPKEWNDLLPILHDEGELLLDSRVSHTSLLDALRAKLSLVPAQYFVAYLVTVADTARGFGTRQWVSNPGSSLEDKCRAQNVAVRSDS